MQTRTRCNDEKFLEAVYSSKTYAEISEKTGQKVASTMARYARTKKHYLLEVLNYLRCKGRLLLRLLIILKTW